MKKLMLFLLVVLLVGTVSALDIRNIDDIKSYDEKNKTYKLENFFGLPLIGKHIADLELKTPQNNMVPVGYGVVAEIEIRNKEFDYDGVINGIELYNIKDGMKEITRDVDYKYRTIVQVPKYKTICDTGFDSNGTAIDINCKEEPNGFKNEVQWIDFTENSLIKGETITLGIFMEIFPRDYIEWIINVYGNERLVEWASITASNIVHTDNEGNSTSLQTYNYTGISFGTADATRILIIGTSGRTSGVGPITSVDVSGVSATKVVEDVATDNVATLWQVAVPTGTTGYVTVTYDITVDHSGIGVWALFDSNGTVRDTNSSHGSPTLTQNLDIAGSGSVVGYLYEANGANATWTGLTEDFYQNLAGATRSHSGASLNFTDDKTGYLINVTIGGGNNLINGVVASWYGTPTPGPTVTLNSPVEAFNSTSQTINFNGTVTSIDGVVNVTLLIDGVLNETNSSGINDTDYLFTKVIADGNHNWTYESCNTNGCVTATTRIFTIDTEPSINVVSPINNSNFLISTVFFNATSSFSIDKWIVNYNGTNTTLSDINTSLTVEDGSFQLLLYANNSVSGVFGLNDSIFFNVNTTPTINVVSPTNGSNFTISTIFFNATSNLSVDTWIVNYNGTNTTLSDINTSLEVEDGSHHLLLYANNSVSGVFGLNDTVFFNVDATIPQVNLTSPTGDQGTFVSGLNLSLNWSIIDSNLDTCFYEYGGSNTTVTCADNFTNLTVTDSTETFLILWANDTFNNLNFNTTNWSYSFIENNVSFEENVSETSSQFFELNLSTSLTVLSISAQLNYNGTTDISSAACDVNCIVNNTIDIPLVSAGEFELKDFFWIIDIFNGTDSISINTSTRNQNVSRIHLEECNATFPVQALNFTVYDEQTLDRISPFTFDGAFDSWLGGGSVTRNSSISNNITEMGLCLIPNETITIDGIIDYDEDGGIAYTNRFYYFDNDEISNVSQDIFMYLLNSSFSTSFILKVQDDSLLPVDEAIIEIHRFYPGTNEFRIVQISKTDDSGKSIGFFQTETVDYKFVIKKAGVTLLETGQQKVIPETSPFTLTFTIGEPLGEPWSSQEDIENLNSSLIWNDTSGIITYIYIDSSGNFTLSRLLVIRESLVNSSADTTICNETSTLASATLTCTVGSTNGFYLASSFITRNIEELDRQFTFQIETLSGVVGLLGLFFGWFLVLIASFMFKFNEIAGIWAVTITVFLINLIGLINFGGVFVTATIAIAIILTWIMER